MAVTTSSSIAFADELPGLPAPGIAADNNQTNTKAALAKLAVISAACGTTAKCVEEGLKTTEKESAKNFKVATVAICVFVAGWCTGQIIDKAITKNL